MTGIHSPSGKSADDVIKEGGADEKRTMKFLYSIAAALFLLLTAALPAEAAQNWMQVYTHVEQMVNKGVEQYNNGDLEGAKKQSMILTMAFTKMTVWKKQSERRFLQRMPI